VAGYIWQAYRQSQPEERGEGQQRRRLNEAAQIDFESRS
jgi:hypothetical protein